ncbi:MAG TPA: hypothetical protein VIK51_25405 [Vicinamibacteria bacterium]
MHARLLFLAAVTLATPGRLWAQHEGHHPPAAPAPSPSSSPSPHAPSPSSMPQHPMSHQMPGMAPGHEMHEMKGFLGSYSMSREASGTSWQPDSSPMEGIHWTRGAWTGMVHGFADVVYDHQGGPRGDDDVFGPTMLMVMAQRPAMRGTFGLRTMLSIDPATVGRSGYPLLLQTGETADGHTPLVDRQHPHDLFMELAVVYSHPLGPRGSVFGYFGLPGEPALGPPTFMHRFSGMELPEAPIGHHWLDSSHITFGVATAGVTWGRWKVEASAFNGSEPDENRWDIEAPRFNSGSGRVTFNPSANWSLQASYGHLTEPEQLEPGIDVNRATASVTYNHARAGSSNWQSTLAWGRNAKDPGDSTNAVLLESTLRTGRHTLFGRGETARKDELFESGAHAHEAFDVGKITVGYILDVVRSGHLALGVGGLGSLHFVPAEIERDYGSRRPRSFMLFVRGELR